MRVETRNIATRTRALKVAPASLNVENRTVDIVFATGAAVEDFKWDNERGWIRINERLSMDPAHIRKKRLENGLPILDNHKRWEGQRGQLGKVENPTYSEEGLGGTARFSRRKEVDEIFQDVQDGIADTWSVGYRVHAYEIKQRTDGLPDDWLAVDWEPLEASLAPIPADPDSRTRSSADDMGSCELRFVDEKENETSERAVEPQPVVAVEENTKETHMSLSRADMMKLMKRADEVGVTLECLNAIIAKGGDERSVDDLTDDILAAAKERRQKLEQERAEADKTEEKERKAPSGQMRTGVTEITSDQAEKEGRGLINYLEHRADGKVALTDDGRQFVGMDMIDICRKVLRDTGRSDRGGRMELARAAMMPVRPIERSIDGRDRARDVGGLHTTSDFPDLLGDGLMRRRLVKAYNDAQDDYSSFVNSTTFSDPRSQKFIRVGGMTALPEVKEGAEYKRGTFGEESEELSISKRGKIIGLSLEAILRDDLSAFVRLPANLGRTAKKTESKVVFAVLTLNPMMQNGNQLFSVANGNIGSANAPDMTGITDARKVMRKQSDVGLANDPESRIGITPAHIAAPYKYELGLGQLLGPKENKATETGDIVPGYIRNMTFSISDHLDIASTQIWYAFANPNDIECIVVARLEGNQPFEIERRVGWEVDGVEWKIRHWFGAGAVDHRGCYRNAGV